MRKTIGHLLIFILQALPSLGIMVLQASFLQKSSQSLKNKCASSSAPARTSLDTRITVMIQLCSPRHLDPNGKPAWYSKASSPAQSLLMSSDIA